MPGGSRQRPKSRRRENLRAFRALSRAGRLWPRDAQEVDAVPRAFPVRDVVPEVRTAGAHHLVGVVSGASVRAGYSKWWVFSRVFEIVF